MKSFIALALAAAVSADEIKAEFMQYISKNGRNYASVEEFNTRFGYY
jgi:hypothetical protein